MHSLKILIVLSFTLISLSALGQTSHSAHSHPNHNMILTGTDEIFASHIVYKQPHNYQVILQLELDQKTRQTYLKSKLEHTEERHILLLDSMDIGEIENKKTISGKIQAEDVTGVRRDLVQNVVLSNDHFKIVYFNELPLSLE